MARDGAEELGRQRGRVERGQHGRRVVRRVRLDAQRVELLRDAAQVAHDGVVLRVTRRRQCVTLTMHGA